MSLLDQSTPRTIPEVIATGVKLGVRTFWVVAALQFVLISADSLVTHYAMEDAIVPGAAAVFPWRELGLVMLVLVVVGGFVNAVALRYMWDFGTQGAAQIGVALHAAPRVLAKTLVQLIPLLLAVGLGLLLLIVPGVIVMVALMLAPVAVTVEGIGPIDGLKRSWELVWDRWWHSFGVLVCAGLPLAAIYWWTNHLVDASGCGAEPTLACTAAAFASGERWILVQVASGLLIAPFTSGVTLALFHDLRFRVANLPLRTDPVT